MLKETCNCLTRDLKDEEIECEKTCLTLVGKCEDARKAAEEQKDDVSSYHLERACPRDDRAVLKAQVEQMSSAHDSRATARP